MAQDHAAFRGEYPTTRKSDQKDLFFGREVADPYRWLEDDLSEETKDWVRRQNEVTFSYLERIPFRDAIRERLETLWNYEKYSAPFKEGKYTYYFKNDGLQNQYVLYREDAEGNTELFLDPNEFSEDGTSSLAGIEFSKDGSLCAIQISEGGSDWRKVLVLRAEDGKVIDDTLRNVKFSGLSWRGNQGFYYSSYDEPQTGSALSGRTEHHKLFFHRLGTPQSEDQLVFGGEETPRRYIGGQVTENQHYLVITAANATYGNELYIQDLRQPGAPILPLVTGFEQEQDIVYAAEGKLFILTNENAPNRRLMVTDAAHPQKENWKELIPQAPFPLTVSTGGNKIFARYLMDAVSKVYQYDLNGNREKEINLPGLGTASGFSAKAEEKEVYYSYTSYIDAPTIFRLDLATGESQVYKKAAIAVDTDQYESRQVFYPSKDGTTIPMIITHKKGLALDGKNPTMLYGYGGFNISLTPSFSISNLVFMENGGVYAVANLRGGGEYGQDWHKAGTQQSKQNVFDDFIAAAEYLIAEGYTDSSRLAISGGSNGGLLVGAVMTQRPGLFAACFPAVGVLDMLRYHQFTAGAGWSFDYGTADDSKEMFEYLLGYSPVHNVRPGTCYPATLVMTGDHDDRVVPAHSFKFAAELQDKQSCDHPVMIRILTNAGHGAGKPTSMIIEEQADKWAFLFYTMGLNYNLK